MGGTEALAPWSCCPSSGRQAAVELPRSAIGKKQGGGGASLLRWGWGWGWGRRGFLKIGCLWKASLRSFGEEAHRMVEWSSNRGKRSQGRARQTYSGKGRTVNISGLAGRTAPVAACQLCFPSREVATDRMAQ